MALTYIEGLIGAMSHGTLQPPFFVSLATMARCQVALAKLL